MPSTREGIELKLNVKEVKIRTTYPRSSFEKPIIFYLQHKDDKLGLFYSFVIYDLHRGTITYYTSYLPENLNIILKQSSLDRYIHLQFCKPHHVVEVNRGKDFFISTWEASDYIFYVNTEKEIMRIVTKDDLGLHDIDAFGNTWLKYNDKVYLSAGYYDNDQNIVNVYEASKDLSSIKQIFQYPKFDKPHTTGRVKDFIINIHFTPELKVNGVDKIYGTHVLFTYVLQNEYSQLGFFTKARIAIRDYFNHRKQKSQQQLSLKSKMNDPQSRINKIILSQTRPTKEQNYEAYYNQLKEEGNNLLFILENYEYKVLPSTIFVYNTVTGELQNISTTKASPAHFETNGDYIYISNHNVFFVDKIYYLGTASIDKFKVLDDRITFEDSFTHDSLYRITTHKVFTYDDKEYIVTIGHPNRIFFIDATDMSLIGFEDLGEDYLSASEDLFHYLNSNSPNIEDYITSMVVSKDGKILVFLSQKYLYLYSFPERRIIKKIRYVFPMAIAEDIDLKDFNPETTHMQFIE